MIKSDKKYGDPTAVLDSIVDNEGFHFFLINRERNIKGIQYRSETKKML